MKEAANGGGLPSRRCGLNVRCEGLRVRRRAWFVHLQFKIGRFVQKSCGNLGVRCCFSHPKQDRRLTHEVLFSDHGLLSPWYPSADAITRQSGIRSGELCYKVNFTFCSIKVKIQIRTLRDLSATGQTKWNKRFLINDGWA